MVEGMKLIHSTRRALLRAAGVVFTAAWVRAAGPVRQALEVDRLARSSPGSARVWSRWYQANARVYLLGVPLLSKRNAGGAVAMIEESGGGPSRMTALQFNAGSWPEKLGGFNRFGFMQEIVRQDERGFVESAFVGLMTSAPEKNATEARRSWSEKTPGAATVTHGQVKPEGATAVVAHMGLRRARDWTKAGEVLEEFRNLAQDSASRRGAPPAPTFLYALREQICNPAVEASGRIFHAGKLYTLRTQKESADSKHWPPGTVQLNGWIRNPEGHDSAFKVWLEPGGVGLPLAFEFRPRSFLELTFERADPMAGAAVGRLLGSENS